MYATFAFIGLFALGSVDAVITGGADFGPSSAYADEYRSAHVAAAPAASPALAAMTEEADAVLKTVAAEEVNYSFTTEVLLGGPEVIVGDEPMVSEAALMELAPPL